MMNRSNMPHQIMNMAGGGIASFVPRETKIMGQPHMLAYINPQEEQLLQDYRGNAPTVPGPGNVPAYYLFGFKDIGDMFDGGGAGGSGDSFYAGSHDDYVASGGTGAVAHSTDDDDDPIVVTTDDTPREAISGDPVGTLKQDENGDWYEVVTIEGTNATGRNYSVDPSDNSKGPIVANKQVGLSYAIDAAVAEAVGGDTYVPKFGISKEHDEIMEKLALDKSINPDMLVGKRVPLSSHEQALVDNKGWIDNGDGTLTPIDENGNPQTWNYDGDRDQQWDWQAADGYEVSDLSEEQGNTIFESLANLLTPFDGQEYINGQLVTEYNEPEATELSTELQNQYKKLGEGLSAAGVMNVGGKQLPAEPENVGNTPIFTYDGSDDDPSTKMEVVDVLTQTDNYADLTAEEKAALAKEGLVEGGEDGTLVGSEELIDTASLATDEDGNLYVPYGGLDAHDFSTVETFPGSLNPNSEDYSMSKDLRETQGYYGYKYNADGTPVLDENGKPVLDLSKRNTDTTWLEQGLVDANGNKLINTPNILNVASKEYLLNTGDSSKMVTTDDSGGYTYLDDTVITGPGTSYDPTGGGLVLTSTPDGDKVLSDEPVQGEVIPDDDDPITIFDPWDEPEPEPEPEPDPDPDPEPQPDPDPEIVTPLPITPTPGYGSMINFYGGYQPVSRGETLVTMNRGPFLGGQMPDSVNPIFPQRDEYAYIDDGPDFKFPGGEIIPFNDTIPGPVGPAPLETSGGTIYNPTGTLPPEIAPIAMARGGIASIMSMAPATRAMYQGIMS